MGWFSEDIETMEHLFVHGLQDIYYAEHQIEKSLPDMIEKASDAELKRDQKLKKNNRLILEFREIENGIQ